MDVSPIQPAPTEAHPRTILSLVQAYSSHDAFPTQSTHPFASDPENSMRMLRELIDATLQISGALNAHISLPMTNHKLFSLFKQQTAIAHSVHNAEQTVRKSMDIMRKRHRILYGEDIPLDRTRLLDWCISRFEAWGTSAGMEAFKEEQREGHITLILGGKVIVVDMDLAADRSDPFSPRLSVTGVKTSYAVTSGAASSTTAGSTSLDAFLAESLGAFLVEVQKDEELQDPDLAAKMGTRIADSLKYLMQLDHLAAEEGEAGLRWFNHNDLLSLDAERFASEEAAAISKELPATSCPLDIFLMRAHSLPLPYLTVPSLSFLVYVSPLAYLTMLRSAPATPSPPNNPFLPALDIPFSIIRSHTGSHPRPPGVTTVNLVLASFHESALSGDSSPVGMEGLAPRPTFPLVPSGEQKDIYMPEAAGKDSVVYNYVLDFTDGERYPGVVMSQSRMREIEMVINPLGSMEAVNNVSMMSFNSGSWVDMLLNPQGQLSPEFYSALYVSPTSAHPQLQLRLAVPEEPGFRLEKVRVRNLKTVWGILEVVREQCWVNETLLSCQWSPEGLGSAPIGGKKEDDSQQTTEDELQAVLGGTVTPDRIPVNVYVHNGVHTADPDPIFDPTDIAAMAIPARTTKIAMSLPERPPITGLVEVSVAYDSAKPRGVAVTVDGAMGADLNIDALEEVCRRGGALGLAGRVWAKTHGSA